MRGLHTLVKRLGEFPHDQLTGMHHQHRYIDIFYFIVHQNCYTTIINFTNAMVIMAVLSLIAISSKKPERVKHGIPRRLTLRQFALKREMSKTLLSVRKLSII